MRDAPESDGSALPREAPSLLRFAGLLLDLDASTLARESGEPIPLTRGEFALLRVFVARPGRVIGRDALLGALANRRFEPFDRSVDVLVGKLRRKIEPDPKQPRLIVTVPGEGYRFDGLAKTSLSDPKPPIIVLAPQDDPERPALDSGSRASSEKRAERDLASEAKPAQQAVPVPGTATRGTTDRTMSQRSRPRIGVVPLAAAVVLLLAIAGGWAILGGHLKKSQQAAHLSIVVLPFANLSGDPSQEYLADGITDNLTTELSRIAANETPSRASSRATPLSPTRAEISKPSRSARSSTSATCSKARYSATGAASVSTRSSSTPNPARICGPIGSRRTWPTCSSCRMKSWRDWAAAWIWP
jgi:DNA-binding winged helix-turn-helix (wHTH) protein